MEWAAQWRASPTAQRSCVASPAHEPRGGHYGCRQPATSATQSRLHSPMCQLRVTPGQREGCHQLTLGPQVLLQTGVGRQSQR